MNFNGSGALWGKPLPQRANHKMLRLMHLLNFSMENYLFLLG